MLCLSQWVGLLALTFLSTSEDARRTSFFNRAGNSLSLQSHLLDKRETGMNTPQASDFQHAKRHPDWWMESDEIRVLGDALVGIAMNELSNCSLVVAFDQPYGNNAVNRILRLPHQRQVLEVSSSDNFTSIAWESLGCRGYFLLFSDPHMILTFLDSAEEPWDYHGKYVFVGFSKSQLNQISNSKKGRKTQHMVGLIQANSHEWQVYMNQLYWGKNMMLINRWRRNRFTSDAQIFPNKIYNLQGATLKMITFEFAPHVLYEVGAERESAGRDIQVAKALSKILNFTLELQEPPPGELWGSKLANGTWTGLVASLAKNVGDFGMANIFLSNNNDRTKVQGFTRSYDADLSCFMARTDPPLPRWQSLALPFQRETWLAILISLMVFCPILYGLGKLSAINANEMNNLQYLTTSSLYNWAIHFRQSQHQVPMRPGTQILIIFLWLYVMILTTGYSSNLTAFLTVSRARASMETFKELYSSKQEVLGLGYFFKTSLASSGNAYLKGLTDRYQGLSDFNEVYELLQSGKGVFLESRKYLEYLIGAKFTDQGVPKMRIMEECYSPYSIAIATQKHFPLKRSFDTAIAWIFESGLVRKWFLDTLRINQKITDKLGNELLVEDDEGTDNDGVIPLGIDHMQGLFFILVVGLSLSVFVFALEVFCCQKH